jgi:FtsX-like permease family protein
VRDAPPIVGMVRLLRGSMTLRRMNAYRLVLAAAGLTVFVTAALAVALASFAGAALPQAAHRQLAAAPGTALDITGSVTSSQAGRYQAGLQAAIRRQLAGVPVTLYQALWSDPLRLATAGPALARLTGKGNVLLTQAAAFGAIRSHAVLVAGHWPAAPRPGQPVQAALPQAAALLAHLSPGAQLQTRDQVSGRPTRFLVAGIFRPETGSATAAGYWALNTVGASGTSSSGGFTTLGPLAVSPAAFTGPLAVNSASWVAQPDTWRIPVGQLTSTATRAAALRQALANSTALPSLQVSTNLPAVLDAAAASLAVARSLLVIGALELALVAAAAVATAAAYLADQREGESALLASRGTARFQLARLNAAEAVLLCLIATAAGGLAGGRLAALLASAGPLHAAGLRLPGFTPGVGLALAVTAAGSILVLLWPALRTLAPGIARQRRGRQAAVSGIARAGADLALISLAVLAGWQLRHYSAVVTSANGPGGVDPVLVLAPALALAGGTALTLRGLPPAARAADRLASRGRRLSPALSCWQLSRRPLSQAAGALLIVLAVATGTLALSQHRSWAQSAADQAAFSAGADTRVDLASPLTASAAGRLTAAPGVRGATPVATLTGGGTGETLALNAGTAAGVVLLRRDQSAKPAPALFRAIRPAGAQPGVLLPGQPSAVQLDASLGPASLRLAPAAVTLSVADADGDVYQVSAGTLAADGRPHLLTARLGTDQLSTDQLSTGQLSTGQLSTVPRPGRVITPLRLIGITASYQLLPHSAKSDAAVHVLHVGALGTATGPARAVPGSALSGWAAAVSAPELAALRTRAGQVAGASGPPQRLAWKRTNGQQLLSFTPGYGQALPANPGQPLLPIFGQLTLTAAAPSVTPIPAIATQSFLAASNTGVGATVDDSLNGLTVAVHIVAVVHSFPTVASGGALILDLPVVQQALLSRGLPPVPVTSWWLATGGAAPLGLAGLLPAGSSVTSRDQLAAGLLGNPLSAAPQQAVLAVAIAAALLAIAGFFVSIAANVAQRRQESALLAALGVTQRSQAGQLCTQELLLSVPAAVAGLVLGGLLTILLVPAVTLTPAATAPVPTALTTFAWAQALGLAALVVLLPVLVAAAAAARTPDPAATLRTAESA